MDIDPSALDLADRYKILIGSVVPRPIAWVSTLSPHGRPNLAPFSFFNGVSSNPLSILFCPANKPDGSEKDTLRNLSHPAAQFVVNIVTHAQSHRMASTAEELPYGESEWDLASLAPAPSRIVKPARVKEAPIAFECEVSQIIRLNPGAPSGGNIVIGRVVSIHAAEGLVNAAHHVDAARLDAIGRMAGISYCTTRDRFEIPWGRKALERSPPPPSDR
ncbi:MAG: flavin reductase family protein [Phycisphaerae bacterium]|nr:flavin reductase family protein [Phycisphaerae bacterium]